MVNTGKELIDICQKRNIKIWEYTVEQEVKLTGKSRKEIFNNMKKNFAVMKNSADYEIGKRSYRWRCI